MSLQQKIMIINPNIAIKFFWNMSFKLILLYKHNRFLQFKSNLAIHLVKHIIFIKNIIIIIIINFNFLII